MLWKRVVVSSYERLLVVKNGRVTEILEPGDHWRFVSPGASLELERHDVRDLVFQSRWTEFLLEDRPDLVERYFTVVETSEVQVALVYVDDILYRVQTPAKSMLFWRGAADVRAEVVEVLAEPDMPVEMLSELERSR